MSAWPLLAVALLVALVAVVAVVVRASGRQPHAPSPGSVPPPSSDGPAAPDWYPDPEDPSMKRFWDGSAWTERTEPY